MQFPRLVYKSASHHKPVVNEVEHAEALKEGWHASVPEAMGQKATVATEKIEQVEDLGTNTPAPAPAPVTSVAPPSGVVVAQPKPRKGKETVAPIAPSGEVKAPWA